MTVPVTLLWFRPPENPFASLSSLFVLALAFRRPARLRPRLHRQSVTDRQSQDRAEHVRLVDSVYP